MKKKYKVIKAEMKEETPKFKKGDLVNIIGKKQFTTPTGKVYFSMKPGVAKIDAIMPGDVKHPYHLVAIDNSTSNVKGWVSEEDFELKPEEKQIESISFAKSKNSKIAFAKNTTDGIEMLVTNWKDENWTAVFRPRDPQTAEKIAKMAEAGCAKKHFSDVFAYSTTFIEICLDAANVPVGDIVNKQSLISSGLFSCFTEEEYTNRALYLRRGDILLSNNNSAVVLSDGLKASQIPTIKVSPKESTEQPKEVKIVKEKVDVKPEVVTAQNQPEEKDYDLAGVYLAITPATVRTGAGIDAAILTKIPKGSSVKNYGFYTQVKDIKWYYIQTKYKNTIYNGFVSEKCFIRK